VTQTGNLIQALLMNPSRCRRRLRRGLEDWANLYQHALNADTSPTFEAYMVTHGWKWTPPHPEEIAVSVCVCGGGGGLLALQGLHWEKGGEGAWAKPVSTRFECGDISYVAWQHMGGSGRPHTLRRSRSVEGTELDCVPLCVCSGVGGGGEHEAGGVSGLAVEVERRVSQCSKTGV
jgi:hypothetical protein